MSQTWMSHAVMMPLLVEVGGWLVMRRPGASLIWRESIVERPLLALLHLVLLVLFVAPCWRA